MSAPTTTRSAYPAPVDDLIPAARELAAELGHVPSRNRLMNEFRIGAKKATTLLKRINPEPGESTDELGPARLHAVPTGTEVEDWGPADEPTEPTGEETSEPEPSDDSSTTAPDRSEPVSTAPNPDTTEVREGPSAARVPAAWPVLLLALPAFVAIWSGWVGLGTLTGFGMVHPLPGIADDFAINTAITLPIGVETYAAYALRVWLSGAVPPQARAFAKWSALGALALGALGQIAYHLMTAAGMTHAPWWITTVVSCLPVAVLGMGAALTHLLGIPNREEDR